MKIMKRFFAGLACALMICGLLAPVTALANKNDGRVRRVIASDTISYDAYDYYGKHVTTTIEYEISGYYKNDPQIMEGEHKKKRGDKYHLHDYAYNYHGYVSAGDSIHLKVTFRNETKLCGHWIYPETKTGKWGEGRISVLKGGDSLEAFTSVQEADYVVADDIAKIDVGCMDDNPTGEIQINYMFTVDKGTQTVAQTASPNPGEDEGTTIWGGIVEPPKPTPGGNYERRDGGDPGTAVKIAVSVAGAVVAGAIALGGQNGKKGGGEEEEEEKKQKFYRMKVYKNFGDGVRRGADAVPVWARIVEVVEGHEENRPDLSERITASGEGMNVSLAGMRNTYQTAMISVPADSTAEKALLVFTFVGDGGVFRNRISFRVLGDPRIVFPRMTQDGTGWVVNTQQNTVRMVAGRGGTERLRFVIMDANGEPTDIAFKDAQGFSIRYTKDMNLAFTYWAEITNQTPPMEKDKGIFAEPENRDITVRAVFADGSSAVSSFRVELWPDGLSVPAKDAKDGAVLVDTRPDERAGEGFAGIRPAGFEVYVCYTDTNGAPVILENPTLRFGGLDDGGKYGMTLRENFKFDLSRTGSAGFLLFPKVTLPVLAEPYEAVMPISYGEAGSVQAYLPLRFLGETPTRPSSAKWNEAYERLKKSVTYFGIGDEPGLRTLVRNAEKHSAAELESIRYQVIQAGVVFYRKQLLEYQGFDQLCTRYLVVAGCYVKVGDFAVEFAMSKWFGGYGKLAGKFMNPLKNMLAAYAGQFIGPGSEWDGRYEDMPFLKTLLQSCDEALAAAITGAFISGDLTDPTSFTAQFGKYALKVSGKASDEVRDAVGYVIAAYLMVSFTEHYYGMKGDQSDQGDFYRSTLAAIKDLGYEGLKAWVLKRVEDVAKPVMEKVGALCGEIYRSFCQSKVNEAAVKAGQQMMDYGLRRGLKYDGYMFTMSEVSYKTAQKVRDYAFKETIRIQNEYLDKQIKAFVNMLGDTADDLSKTDTNGILVGQVLNYFVGGKAGDESQSLGVDAKEIGFELISGWLTDTLGVTPDRVIAASAEAAASLNVDMRIEGDRIILEILGYTAEISILKNFPAMCDLMLDWLLSWLESVWEVIRTPFDPSGVPDPRDRAETDVDRIEADIETQKHRAETAEWKYNGNKKMTWS